MWWANSGALVASERLVSESESEKPQYVRANEESQDTFSHRSYLRTGSNRRFSHHIPSLILAYPTNRMLTLLLPAATRFKGLSLHSLRAAVPTRSSFSRRPSSWESVQSWSMSQAGEHNDMVFTAPCIGVHIAF